MRLSTIRNLYGSGGPWASVYLDATGTQKTGTPQETRYELDLRWRAARESLRSAGADEATLRAIDDVIRRAPVGVGPAEVAVLASHGSVAYSRTVPVAPNREAASWSPQPHAADLVRAFDSVAVPETDRPRHAHRGRPDEVRWLRADVDRTGGAITSYDGHTETVAGDDDFVTKLGTAGRDRIWSTPRFQRAAQVNWDHNSRELVRALTAEVERTDADMVVLAGDVRARQLVIDNLPPTIADRVVEVDHEVPVRPHRASRLRARREPDVYDPVLVEATRDAIHSVVDEHRAEVADRFHYGLSHGESVRGLGPVCQAARELRIDTLVLSPQPSPRLAWVDPVNPTMVGESKRDTGTEFPVREPADDALVGAAAIAGAESVVIEADADLVDGLGAILRYPDERAPRVGRGGAHDPRGEGPVMR